VRTFSAALMDSGMAFQMTGPATEKAVSLNLVWCSCCCWKNVVAGAWKCYWLVPALHWWCTEGTDGWCGAMYISSATLNLTWWTSGSQCSSHSAGPTWSRDDRPITTQVAAFCTRRQHTCRWKYDP